MIFITHFSARVLEVAWPTLESCAIRHMGLVFRRLSAEVTGAWTIPSFGI